MFLNEKCGIFGIYGNQSDASRLVYYGLWALQHRGQENSGIASSTGRKIYCHKGQGLVAQAYRESDFKTLRGNIAIGHNRYSTFGKSQIDHAQPVYTQQNIMASAHNGNLPIVSKLKRFLKNAGLPTDGLNDSEMMYKAIEYWLIKGKNIEDAIKLSFPLFHGAFSLLVMTKKELVAVRDANGIRPLCMGRVNGSYVFASETCALDTIGAEFVRDVAPGEMVVVDKDGPRFVQIQKGKERLDIFEYIYFARPDSYLQGKSIYQIRKNLGIALARKVKISADMIIPVPDSGIPAAIGFSQESGIKLEEVLVKNRYIHRTFIQPSQRQRSSGVKMKLNLIKEVVKGKRVILIDDSIVRGTTSKLLAEILRSAGPKEIHMVITSPPVKFPDFYGINTPKKKDLVAANMSIEQLRKYIGVDSLTFLTLKETIDAIGVPKNKLCTSCFDGEYPVKVPVF
ncbi:amidophosphoribosyltransferase [candidate division WWE3 bacterium CG_4_9_14_0_2_um_filter_35_11]|uniref:Amidophosphoribosyltransferase n=1 Tax=candidate division WWE3 bacterium CG_4_9_14_0_2_um_filter_35_11 TaxID=1975077 RepID=A0A2M8EL03_UNCKA|nr:MAG: amidophosphoribosyltransferase [candidate division WWE3 bacterium CG_4_9_14_0_2_um_filter_35_11]